MFRSDSGISDHPNNLEHFSNSMESPVRPVHAHSFKFISESIPVNNLWLSAKLMPRELQAERRYMARDTVVGIIDFHNGPHSRQPWSLTHWTQQMISPWIVEREASLSMWCDIDVLLRAVAVKISELSVGRDFPFWALTYNSSHSEMLRLLTLSICNMSKLN